MSTKRDSIVGEKTEVISARCGEDISELLTAVLETEARRLGYTGRNRGDVIREALKLGLGAILGRLEALPKAANG